MSLEAPGLWPFLTRVGVRAASPCPSHHVSGVPITGVLSLPPREPRQCASTFLTSSLPQTPTADNEKASCGPLPSHPCLSSGASCVVVTCIGGLRPSPTCYLEASHNCRVAPGHLGPTCRPLGGALLPDHSVSPPTSTRGPGCPHCMGPGCPAVYLSRPRRACPEETSLHLRGWRPASRRDWWVEVAADGLRFTGKGLCGV